MTTWTSEVLERYQNSGLAGRLLAGQRPAVIVVDLQLGFTTPSAGPGFALDSEVAATRTLIDLARQLQLPVLFTTIVFDDETAPQAATWLRKMPALGVLASGSGWEDIDARLDPRPDEPVITKQTASAFAGTDLADRLRALGVDTLLVCGATTSGCVRATVVDACALNFPSFVVGEAVGDREAGPHEAALLDIDAKYGDVVSLEQALAIAGAIR